MTFVFEDVVSGQMRYVNASDLADAIDIFETYEEPLNVLNDSDFEHLHVYVRIF